MVTFPDLNRLVVTSIQSQHAKWHLVALCSTDDRTIDQIGHISLSISLEILGIPSWRDTKRQGYGPHSDMRRFQSLFFNTITFRPRFRIEAFKITNPDKYNCAQTVRDRRGVLYMGKGHN